MKLLPIKYPHCEISLQNVPKAKNWYSTIIKSKFEIQIFIRKRPIAIQLPVYNPTKNIHLLAQTPKTLKQPPSSMTNYKREKRKEHVDGIYLSTKEYRKYITTSRGYCNKN